MHDYTRRSKVSVLCYPRMCKCHGGRQPDTPDNHSASRVTAASSSRELTVVRAPRERRRHARCRKEQVYLLPDRRPLYVATSLRGSYLTLIKWFSDIAVGTEKVKYRSPLPFSWCSCRSGFRCRLTPLAALGYENGE